RSAIEICHLLSLLVNGQRRRCGALSWGLVQATLASSRFLWVSHSSRYSSRTGSVFPSNRNILMFRMCAGVHGMLLRSHQALYSLTFGALYLRCGLRRFEHGVIICPELAQTSHRPCGPSITIVYSCVSTSTEAPCHRGRAPMWV